MTGTIPTLGEALRGSALWRIVALGVLMLLLFIPIGWINDLISERTQRRQQAVQEVSAKWGHPQTVSGPALVVPYAVRWTENDAKGVAVEKTERRRLTILPDQVHVHARIDAENRYRGIFAVPVYRLAVEVNGEFVAPDLAALNIDPALVEWSRSELALGIADVRAVQNRAAVLWDGDTYAFVPGPGDFDGVDGGIHAAVAQPFRIPRVAFALQLDINGSSGVYFTPVGQETVVDIDSNWPDPSFQGNWLPAQRTVGAKGFSATWQIPFLGRNQPQVWTSATKAPDLCATPFGVELITAVDEHRMAERSVKYAHLFILLTFGTIWLIEVLTRLRVHPIQYLLIGAALCIFYLLELSLAEQLGFGIAYLAASAAVTGLIGAYGLVVLRGAGSAAGVAGVVAALYAYLYVLVTNEDYSLLMGSLGLFVALAVTMYLTRSVDWYHLTGEPRLADDVA